MKSRVALRKLLRPVYEKSEPFRKALIAVDTEVDRMRTFASTHIPGLIRADPRHIYLTLTANCNLRCKGCNYGRDFMPGHQLSVAMVKDALDDAKAAGMEAVRLYGGEPLMHKQIGEIVEHCTRIGIHTYMTTNGILLKRKIDEVFEAGLRHLSVGFYGIGEDYNRYVQRTGRFAQLEENLGYVRERYGDQMSMGFEWLLMKPTCNLATVRETWRLARQFRMPIYVNLIHYSLPYFNEGEDRELQFTPDDRPAVEEAIGELLALRDEEPELLPMSPIALRSIPDWLIKGPDMRVPCDRNHLIWVGADGTVQMCYVTFKLGNLHETRLRDLLFTDAHHAAARDAFALNCPNCHCGYSSRTLAHGPTRRLYAGG